MADASAEIARQSFFDLLFRRVRILLEKGLRCHDHSRGTKAALKSGVVDECLLQGIERTCLGIPQSLNCRYGFPVALDGQDPTGIDGFAIHDDRAGAAGALPAGNFGAR